MRLNHRLARLERRTVGGCSTECPSCVAPKDGSTPRPVTLIIPEPLVIGEDEVAIDHSRDFCPACGRQVVLYVPSPRETTSQVY